MIRLDSKPFYLNQLEGFLYGFVVIAATDFKVRLGKENIGIAIADFDLFKN